MYVKLSKSELSKLRKSTTPVSLKAHKVDDENKANAKLFLNKKEMKLVGGSGKIFDITLGERSWKKSRDFINDANFITSNDDLVYLMRDVKKFKSGKRNREYSLNKGKNIFTSSNLPDLVEPNTCGIILIEDESDNVGHWIGYYDDNNIDFILYIDPLLDEIPGNIRKFLESLGKEVKHIGRRIQHFESNKCGLYVVDILRDLSKLKKVGEKSVGKIIKQYEDLDDGINDEMDALANEIKVVSDVPEFNYKK